MSNRTPDLKKYKEASQQKNENDSSSSVEKNEALVPETVFVNLCNDEIILSERLCLAVIQEKNNSAFFYHPEAIGIKNKFEKALAKANLKMKENNCFSCNFKTAPKVVERIAKQAFFSNVFYIIDHSQEAVFDSHKKDILFSTITSKLDDRLKIVIIESNRADLYHER